jgi:translation initiation factor 2B subunit (eIF-2B alpha/beta/delta family)
MVPISNTIAAALAAVHRSLHARADAFEVTLDEVCRLLNQATAAEFVRLDSMAAQLRKNVVARLRGDLTVMTCSLSSTVRDAVLAAAAAGTRLNAIVCESRPLFEGMALGNAWTEGGVSVEVITDAQAAIFVQRADLVLVGADALEAAGVVNKAGTHLLALAAAEAGVPVVVAADTSKLSAGSVEEIAHPGCGGELQGEPVREEKAAREVSDAWPPPGLRPGAAVRNVYFERTPYDLVQRLITEEGELEPGTVVDQVAALRQEFAAGFGLQ